MRKIPSLVRIFSYFSSLSAELKIDNDEYFEMPGLNVLVINTVCTEDHHGVNVLFRMHGDS